MPSHEVDSLLEAINILNAGTSVVKLKAGAAEPALVEAFNELAERHARLIGGLSLLKTSMNNVKDGNLASLMPNVIAGQPIVEELVPCVSSFNKMVKHQESLVNELVRVARQVGIDGDLGAQANVSGSQGSWRELIDNVNQISENLNLQVRTINEVANAVSAGDLTRVITLEAKGEVAALKDSMNVMIRNLRSYTEKNASRAWLKSHLASLTRTLAGQRDIKSAAAQVFAELAPLLSLRHGLFYVVEDDGGEPLLQLAGDYATSILTEEKATLTFDDGPIGQCARTGEIFVSHGLNNTQTYSVAFIPIKFESKVIAVMELASYDEFSDVALSLVEQLSVNLGYILNNMMANSRTELLLRQTLTLANELQTRQDELTNTNRLLEQQTETLIASELQLTKKQEQLKGSNSELERRAAEMAEQKAEVEKKSRQIELAHRALEEKAEQLALISKYKSQFLANMSHELRTPLNSLLVLSQLLAENPEGNLSENEVDFAKTINDAGSELLAIISDILDLSKIESGTIVLHMEAVDIRELVSDVERGIKPMAVQKNLDLVATVAKDLPATFTADAQRVAQVLRNLLSNAVKFTDKGMVTLDVSLTSHTDAEHRTRDMITFKVTDTGIGIPVDKLKIIFEAFHQADGTTSRKYGGTGLGLAISKQLAEMLGGFVEVESYPYKGSTFTLCLPLGYKNKANNESNLDMTIPEGTFNINDMAGPGLSQRQFQNYDVPMSLKAPSRNISKSLLLVMRENSENLIELDSMAKSMGFLTFAANNVDQAISLAARQHPAAAIVDLKILGGLGSGLLSTLKTATGNDDMPIHILGTQIITNENKFSDLRVWRKIDSVEKLLGLLRTQLSERPFERLLYLDAAENSFFTALDTAVELSSIKKKHCRSASELAEAFNFLEDSADLLLVSLSSKLTPQELDKLQSKSPYRLSVFGDSEDSTEWEDLCLAADNHKPESIAGAHEFLIKLLNS